MVKRSSSEKKKKRKFDAGFTKKVTKQLTDIGQRTDRSFKPTEKAISEASVREQSRIDFAKKGKEMLKQNLRKAKLKGESFAPGGEVRKTDTGEFVARFDRFGNKIGPKFTGDVTEISGSRTPEERITGRKRIEEGELVSEIGGEELQQQLAQEKEQKRLDERSLFEKIRETDLGEITREQTGGELITPTFPLPIGGAKTGIKQGVGLFDKASKSGRSVSRTEVDKMVLIKLKNGHIAFKKVASERTITNIQKANRISREKATSIFEQSKKLTPLKMLKRMKNIAFNPQATAIQFLAFWGGADTIAGFQVGSGIKGVVDAVTFQDMDLETANNRLDNWEAILDATENTLNIAKWINPLLAYAHSKFYKDLIFESTRIKLDNARTDIQTIIGNR